MIRTNNCPECGNLFAAKARKCRCGWISEEMSLLKKYDYRCNYQIAGHRCANVGTTTGRNGEWYCGEHWELEYFK